MHTLDTNAIIYYFQNDSIAVPSITRILDGKGSVFVSAVTELELFSFATLRVTEERYIDQLLSSVAIIALDSRIARIGGFLRRQYGLKTPDSAIAATALFTHSTLVTRNIRDFQIIAGLQLKKI